MTALGLRIKRQPPFFLLIMVIFTLLLATQAGKVEIESNLMNMEARGLESVELQYLMVEEFGIAPDVLSITANDIEELRPLAEKIKKLVAVKRVESLIPYLPSSEEQEERAILAEEFAAHLVPAKARNSVDPEALKEEIFRHSLRKSDPGSRLYRTLQP